MAKATRLVVPLRQSPLVSTPGKLVSSASGSRRSFQLANLATAGPVNTKPLSSRANSGGLIGDRALHRAGIGPEGGHSGVELCLPSAEDEDEVAFLDEALCCGAADAGSTTGDDCNFSFKLSHNHSLWSICRIQYS